MVNNTSVPYTQTIGNVNDLITYLGFLVAGVIVFLGIIWLVKYIRERILK